MRNLKISLLYIFKFIGIFYYWIAVNYRYRARDVVYNYNLQNNKRFDRLDIRYPRWVPEIHRWELDHPDTDIPIGYINYEYVNIFKYYWYLITVYIWLNDELPYDTLDCSDLIACNRDREFKWYNFLFSKYLSKAIHNCLHHTPAFDVGSIGYKYPNRSFIGEFLVMVLNFRVCDNLKYKLHI
jgi:hypothetical protein